MGLTGMTLICPRCGAILDEDDSHETTLNPGERQHPINVCFDVVKKRLDETSDALEKEQARAPGRR